MKTFEFVAKLRILCFRRIPVDWEVALIVRSFAPESFHPESFRLISLTHSPSAMSASIEIPGRSSIHNSEADFVVISESPVVQLSDEGDVLDGLEVKMDSFGVHSISLKADIEKLTKENEQLKSEYSTGRRSHARIYFGSEIVRDD